MNIFSTKNTLDKQKRTYLFFISIIVISILLGFFLYFIISNGNKDIVKETQLSFFNDLYNGKINYLSSFFKSLFTNSLYISIIFLLGLSVIGFVFVIALIIFKGFIFGFSISSIIGTYGFKGILMSFFYLFPHQVIYLIILVLMSFYACNFCYRLFKHLFLKTIINFKIISRKYLKVYLFSLICCLLCSIYEVFILPFIIKLFI